MVSTKLPLELEEEILTRVPPFSLHRFRVVCKQWNALFNDKIFINNYLACARPRSEFMLMTDSKLYSVNFNLNDEDPNINIRELMSMDFRLLETVPCDGLFFSYKTTRTATVWNPWLRQTRLIKIDHMPDPFFICGMGYDSSRTEKRYKLFGYTIGQKSVVRYVIYEFASNAWKYFDDDPAVCRYFLYNNVSMHGNLYWVSNYNFETRCFIRVLDCSKEIFKPFCTLPCKNKVSCYSPVLAAFKGERFSLLQQCRITSNIEIWVTKKKITNADDGDDVKWIKFMSVLLPNLPIVCQLHSKVYLVDDSFYGKSVVTCCNDETGQLCVYIVRGDICRKIKLDDVVGELRRCFLYIPSLISLRDFR
ncbi:unnamed protein product [Microthlaspi erraticum]|uniref:F-box domain-containing protein n=1 Tax=Microthlaspi erraticum TaxID=1685480 RepID=A0A6D2IR29_9BRAS|nr:unnamed protein product [Microthlaspi erraticum]